ncbi:MAG: fused MFS/spermidine synthase [Olsenella sp.]|jgi:spermidine synthase|nr:fused MFS/spermidine synthase [Olsenella sp.]MCI1289845.1 fused MFS/spermidine synthase [Olsenella sp.]
MQGIPAPLRVAIIVCIVIDVVFVVFMVVLRKRGVYVKPHTMFGPALVFDSQDDDGVPIRLLNVNGKYQSVSYVQDSLKYRLVCVYHRYFAQIVDIAGLQGGREGRALVIGGGGYSFPKWLVSECPNLRTTVVEIDPKITQIARDHFFLNDLIRDYDAESTGRLSLVTDDGWGYLQHSDQRFDLIVNDAFGGRKPLGPLKTDEGARAVRDHLTEKGVYLANVIAPLQGRGREVLDESLVACRDAFEHVYLIPEAPESPELTGDNVLVASRDALKIQRQYVVK